MTAAQQWILQTYPGYFRNAVRCEEREDRRRRASPSQNCWRFVTQNKMEQQIYNLMNYVDTVGNLSNLSEKRRSKNGSGETLWLQKQYKEQA